MIPLAYAVTPRDTIDCHMELNPRAQFPRTQVLRVSDEMHAAIEAEYARCVEHGQPAWKTRSDLVRHLLKEALSRVGQSLDEERDVIARYGRRGLR